MAVANTYGENECLRVAGETNPGAARFKGSGWDLGHD